MTISGWPLAKICRQFSFSCCVLESCSYPTRLVRECCTLCLSRSMVGQSGLRFVGSTLHMVGFLVPCASGRVLVVSEFEEKHLYLSLHDFLILQGSLVSCVLVRPVCHQRSTWGSTFGQPHFDIVVPILVVRICSHFYGGMLWLAGVCD